MNNDPQILSITIKPDRSSITAGRFNRVSCREALLIVGYGIEGDRKGGHPTRQLHVVSARMLRDLAGEGFQTAPGEMGEQLILDGIDVDMLPAGTCLQLGTEAVIEITAPRDSCSRFAQYQGVESFHEAARRLGVMARVIVGGRVRVGDRVSIQGVECVRVFHNRDAVHR